MNMKMLDDIIDPQGVSCDALLSWINERIEAVRGTTYTPEIIKTFTPVEIQENFDHLCGAEASSLWRRFFLAALVADWASYEKPVDRADFERLKYIMTSAYRTTRIWVCRLKDGKYTPVGYTAWYPILKLIYDGAVNTPEEINDRGVILPSRYSKLENTHHAYIFNFSIAKELQNTSCSKQLLSTFLSEKAFMPNVGALMITVTPEGRKFAEREHFVPIGDITVQGETETLYVRHPVA